MDPDRGTESGGESWRGRAMVCMVISSVVISFGGLMMRSIESADTLQINLYRSLGLLAAVVTILLVRYGSKATRAVVSIGRVGMLGGCLLAIAGFSFLQALSHTTVANTLFILGAIPFFAALFARFLLGETISRVTLATMLVAAAGLLVMVQEGITLGAGYGNGMALATAILFALYAVIVRGKRQTDMMPTLLVSSLLIGLVSLVLLAGDLGVPVRDIMICLAWGALLSGIANFLFIYASRHLAAAEVTLFMLLEFALGPVWVWLFVGETPSYWTIVGGTLIIFAVAMKAAMELYLRPGKKNRIVSGPV